MSIYGGGRRGNNLASMLLGMRATPRIALVLSLAILTAIFLFLTGTSHQTRAKTKQLVWQKVEQANLGRFGFGLGKSTEDERASEEEAMREWEYSRALQYEGSGARIQAFLQKAESGEPFTVSVIGGSVSKGRGLTPPDNVLHSQSQAQIPHGADTLYSPENLHVLVFDWLNTTFPHRENKLVNGAQGGVGAGYFGWCFKEHVPEDSDLVLVELGINDLVELEVLDDYEHLIRGVLELPSKPAIINIETFSILFPTLVSSSGLHGDVNAFYDIPSLAIRDVLLPRIGLDPGVELPKWFRTGEDVTLGDNKVREWGGVPVDLMHISALGHALAASLIIRYLSGQMGKASVPTRAISDPSGLIAFSHKNGKIRKVSKTDVPLGALTLPYKPDLEVVKHNPTCRSMNSPMLHLPSKMGSAEPVAGLVLAEGSHGWEHWAWEEKSYLVAKEVGALASFDFVIRGHARNPSQTHNTKPKETQANILPDETSASEPSPTGNIDYETIPEQEAGESAGIHEDQAQQALEEAISEKEDEITDTPEIGVGRKFPPLPLAARPGGPIDPFSITEDGLRKRDTGVGAGAVLIGYQRSAILGLGSVYCWVDDEREDGTTINGWWSIKERNMGMVDEVASGLNPGPHTLHCEVLEHTIDPGGGTEFRIFAVIYD